MRRYVFLTILALTSCARSAFAQVEAQADITGDWTPVGTPATGGAFHEEWQDRQPGPYLGDYTGLPINEAGRYKAASYNPAWLNVPENQCIPHPATYQHRGPAGLSVAKEYDFTTKQHLSYRTSGSYGLPRTIWMDERPHPPANARHTFDGFSTGKWQGDQLVVDTTHIKAGWMRRNGVPHSDAVHLTEYYIRNGEFLTLISAVDDPAYADEPFIRSTDFKLDPRANPQLREFGGHMNGGPGPIYYRCMPVEELDVPAGAVPSFTEGANTSLEDFAKMFGIPLEAAFGGTATLYPEYQTRLRQLVSGRVQDTRTAPAATAARAAPSISESGQSGDVTSLHVAGQVWMVTAGGRNIAVQVGNDGVLVVDPGRAELAPAVLAEIHRIAGDKKQVRMIVNTSADPARVAANPLIGAATPADGLVNAPLLSANIIAHQNVALRLGSMETGAGLLGGAIPNDTIYGDRRSFYFNDEAIEVIHVPAAHSDGDVIVFFRRSDVVAVGNLIQDSTYPVVLLEQGGSLRGTLAALNQILAITVPSWRAQGGTMVVPGQGRIYDVADVAAYRDMATIVTDRFQDALSKGKTLEQVRQARLTRDFDARYGRLPGPGSTGSFTEVAYRSLQQSGQ